MKLTTELKDLRACSIPDLTKQLARNKQEFILLTIDTQFGKNKNVAKIKKIRQTIARIETIINESIITAHQATLKKSTDKTKVRTNV